MSSSQQFTFRYDLPLLMGALVGLSLSACEMTSPSRVSTSPIEVRHDRYNEMLPTAAVNAELAQMMGRHYTRFGDGPMQVTVTYATGSSEVKATREANRIQSLMQHAGIANVKTGTLPVSDPEQVGQALINYSQVTAHPPRECGSHPGETRRGLASSENGEFPDYRFGCGVDAYIVEQIARPKDLLGNDKIGKASGARASTRLDDYREGKDFDKLSGENASDQ